MFDECFRRRVPAQQSGGSPPVLLVMKIAATTLDETAGDLLSMTLNLGYVASSAILLAIFADLLAVQLCARRFHPVLFWSVVLATSTAGTTMSDLLDRTLGLGYATGASLLAGCLIALTALATRIKDINRVILFWIAFVLTRPLGATFGDLLTKPLEKGGLGCSGGHSPLASAPSSPHPPAAPCQ